MLAAAGVTEFTSGTGTGGGGGVTGTGTGTEIGTDGVTDAGGGVTDAGGGVTDAGGGVPGEDGEAELPPPQAANTDMNRAPAIILRRYMSMSHINKVQLFYMDFLSRNIFLSF